MRDVTTQWPNHALQRPAGTSWLQSLRPVRRVAELGSFVPFCQALRTTALALVSLLTMKQLRATIKLNLA